MLRNWLFSTSRSRCTVASVPHSAETSARQERPMYLPPQFAETRPEELRRIVRDHPLGMLVTHTAAGFEAHHLPFLLIGEPGDAGVLRAHVARANPVWREVAEAAEVMVVF